MEKTIPLLLKKIAEMHPEATAQLSKDDQGVFRPTPYRVFYTEVCKFGAGLLSLGVKREDCLGLISENRKEWFIADLGILSIGCIDVPRGCDATKGELEYILGFPEVKICILENRKQLAKLVDLSLPKLKTVILMDNNEDLPHPSVKILSFGEVIKKGKAYLEKNPDAVENIMKEAVEDDIVTIIFTSGTTGEPKGVMLSHKNLLHQVEHVPELINVSPDDIWLCVLPVWHSFERIMQYVALGAGSALAYSKPVGQIMLADMQKVRPTWMASVPRIWESVKAGVYRNVNAQSPVKKALFHFFVAVSSAHSKLSCLIFGRMPRFRRRIRIVDFLVGILPWLLLLPLRKLGDLLVFKTIKAKLGGRFVAGISGGGALAKDVDDFFAAAGILLLEGYGLTETAPVLGVRAQNHPVPGTVGPVFPGTEIEIRDEEGSVLPPGNRGIVWAKGPQLMKGYYKRPDLTRAIMDSHGWLNTGDLGMLTHDNELKIMGRVKDTIVLAGGENVEPLPIEQKLQESPYIFQSMIVGQDKRFLAALIVPDFAALEEFAKENSITYMEREDLLRVPEIIELINGIVMEQISPRNGFKTFERVFRFTLLDKEFSVGNELSAKQEIKRHVISEKYAAVIQNLFSQV